jgi:hypothetical protein
MQVPLPINIEFAEWGAQLKISIPSVTIPVPPKEEYWREWECQVVKTNSLYNVPLPTKNGYSSAKDWKKWAAYLVNNLYT